MSVDGSANASAALTLAASGVTANTYGTGTSVAQIAVNAKGLITSASAVAISFPVTSVFGRTGAVVLTLADINGISGGLALTTAMSAPSGQFSSNVVPATQGGWIQWNRGAAGFSGEQDFVNNHGSGSGGWAWSDTSGTGTTLTTAMSLSAGGALAVVAGVTSGGTVSANQNFVSATGTVVIAPTGTGNVVARPNGTGSTSGQMVLASSGALTVAAGITCTTINATSSDINIKRNVVAVAPRPLHRLLSQLENSHGPMVGFTHLADGQYRRGNIAQDVERIAPDHMGGDLVLVEGQVNGVEAGTYKTVNQAGMAYEQAMWDALAIDALEARVAELEARL
jgi:hypothetical protein